MKVPLTFRPGGKAQADTGESILNAAWSAGIPLEAPCGGQGWCGKCGVRLDPAPPPSAEDKSALSPSRIREGWRLACRTGVSRSAEVTLPPQGAAGTGIMLPSPTGTPAAARAGEFGIAVDLGTTTLAAQLWDTGRRRLAASAVVANPQSAFGADIISRISASAGKRGLRLLKASLREGLETLLRALLREGGVTPGRVTSITLAGNTTMQHFLLGADPSPLATAPFRPAFLSHAPLPATRLGLRSFRRATVRFIPCASAFVGGDAVGGALFLASTHRERPSLLIDIGTNAELVLLRERSMAATSAAAGPALEGGSLSCGMQAVPGAIEEVEFNGDLTLKTIAAKGPRGLCGSGLIDLTALLLRFGLIEPDGRLLGKGECTAHPWKKLTARLVDVKGQNAFLVSPSRGPLPRIVLTQDDIRELQLAFSAVTTAWQLLLRKARCDPDSIRTVFLTGGFGYSLRAAHLTALGLIPGIWEERIAVTPNASLSGAAQALLDPPFLSRARRASERITAWHLAESRDFSDLFIHNLSFPAP